MFWQLRSKYEHPRLIFGNFISFFVFILHLKQVFDIKMFIFNKMVREPNVSPHKQIIKDDNVKECISIE